MRKTHFFFGVLHIKKQSSQAAGCGSLLNFLFSIQLDILIIFTAILTYS